MKNKFHTSSSLILFAFLLCITMVVATAYIFYLAYHPHIFIPDIQRQFIPEVIENIRPKPREQFVFIATLLLVPLLCFISIKITTCLKQISRVSVVFLITCCIFLLGYMLYYSNYLSLLISPLLLHAKIIFLLGLLTGYIFYTLIKKNSYPDYFAKKLNLVFFLVIALAIIIPTLSYRISNLHSIWTHKSVWNNEFEAVFYVVSQVVTNRTLLIDLPSQYGLYAEFLFPLFKLTGLSVLKFTITMEILQISALLVLFISLTQIIRSRILILLCMLTVCMVCGTWSVFNVHLWNPCYQYFPIRLLFPMLSIGLFLQIIKSKTIQTRHVILFSIFSACAMLWNLDSGFPITGAYLAYIASYLIFPTQDIQRKKAWQLLLISVGIIFATLVTFIFYLEIKSGFGPLHLSWLTKYQHIFYQTGYMAISLPIGAHAWQIIYGIYLLSITLAVYHWIHQRRSRTWDMTFYLSILGYGLFMYYEGRAHPYNLITVSWPAIVIAFIFCDHLMRLLRNNLISRSFSIICLPIIFFGVIVSADYFYAMPFLYKMGIERWSVMLSQKDNVVTRNLDFINNHLGKEKTTIILAPNQSIYFAESGKLSALQGPGLEETILQQDFKQITQQLKAGSSKTVFLQLTDQKKIPDQYKLSLANYQIINISKDDLAFMVLKS